MAQAAGKRVTWLIALAAMIGTTGVLMAQIGIGTWAQVGAGRTSTMTMTVEACCNGGLRFLYRLPSNPAVVLMTIESPMDGTDVPVIIGGKPSGETMSIKRLDDHHTFTVLKMNGKQFGTSKATMSADGKTLTVENEITSDAAGQTIGKSTETWVRK